MLKFIKQHERILTYILFGLVIIFIVSLPTCNKNTDYQNQNNDSFDSLALVQKYDSILNKKDQQIYLQTAIVTNNQALIKKLSDSVFDLKKKNTRKSDNVITYTSSYTDTELEDYLLGFKDTTEFRQFSDSVTKACEEVINYAKANTITVPRTLKDSSEHFKFVGTLTKAGLNIDTLSFPDSTYSRIVEHKGGLLKRDSKGKLHVFLKKSFEFQTFHTNPYVKTKQINSIVFKPKEKQRWLERIAIAGASIYITSKILK